MPGMAPVFKNEDINFENSSCQKWQKKKIIQKRKKKIFFLHILLDRVVLYTIHRKFSESKVEFICLDVKAFIYPDLYFIAYACRLQGFVDW